MSASAFYVRGPQHEHVFTADTDWCTSCREHHSPSNVTSWHIEMEGDVDTMLCGIKIGLDTGEVRESQPRDLCPDCARQR